MEEGEGERRHLAVLPLCSPGLPRYSGRSRGAREGWEVEEGVPGSSPRSLASPRWMSGQAREVFVEMVALLGVVAVAVEEEEGRRAGPGEAGGVAVRGGGEAARRADTWAGGVRKGLDMTGKGRAVRCEVRWVPAHLALQPPQLVVLPGQHLPGER